jgi:hypothetical protein
LSQEADAAFSSGNFGILAAVFAEVSYREWQNPDDVPLTMLRTRLAALPILAVAEANALLNEIAKLGSWCHSTAANVTSGTDDVGRRMEVYERLQEASPEEKARLQKELAQEGQMIDRQRGIAA